MIRYHYKKCKDTFWNRLIPFDVKAKFVLNFAKKKLQPLLFLLEWQYQPKRKYPCGLISKSAEKEIYPWFSFNRRRAAKKNTSLGFCSAATQMLRRLSNPVMTNRQHRCPSKKCRLILIFFVQLDQKLHTLPMLVARSFGCSF